MTIQSFRTDEILNEKVFETLKNRSILIIIKKRIFIVTFHHERLFDPLNNLIYSNCTVFGKHGPAFYPHSKKEHKKW